MYQEMGFTSAQIQDFEDEIEQRAHRRAKIANLQTQVDVLQGRLSARDEVIKRQRSKIEQLQRMLVRRSKLVAVNS